MAGNLAPGQNPDTYTFTIPSDFAPGDYTWAWTWVNKIAAEAEFYMNCAPIRVTAAVGEATATKKRGKERRRAAAAEKRRRETTGPSYPDLFLANIGSASNGCTTAEAVAQQIAIAFPFPGSSVSYPNGREDLFPQACDGNPRNQGASATGGAQSTQEAVSATGGGGSATMSSLAGSTALTSVGSSSSAPTVSSAGAVSGETTASSSSVLLTMTPSSSTWSTVATSLTASAAASSTGTSILDSPCTDGHLLCVGGTKFSTCTGGAWDAPQDLAAHTTCEGTEGVGLTIINQF